MKFHEDGSDNSEVKKCETGWRRSAVEMGRGYTYSWLIYSTVQSIEMSLSYRVSQYRTHTSRQLTGYVQPISQQFDFRVFHYII